MKPKRDDMRRRPGKNRPMIQRYSDYRRSLPSREPVIPPRAAVPSFFTVMNLFCGFLSIVETSQGRWGFACSYILLAGLFDLLDGFMARLTRGTSEFGMQLDSLSDMVSFGLASSFLIYNFGLNQYEQIGLIVASLPSICGAVRLARYNLGADGEKHDHFSGLPIPAQAIAIVALVLASLTHPALMAQIWEKPEVLVSVIIGLSILMVSNIKFDAVPSFNRRAMTGKLPILGFAAISCLLCLLFRETGLLIAATTYILFSVFRAVFRFLWAVWNAAPEDFDVQ